MVTKCEQISTICDQMVTKYEQIITLCDQMVTACDQKIRLFQHIVASCYLEELLLRPRRLLPDPLRELRQRALGIQRKSL